METVADYIKKTAKQRFGSALGHTNSPIEEAVNYDAGITWQYRWPSIIIKLASMCRNASTTPRRVESKAKEDIISMSKWKVDQVAENSDGRTPQAGKVKGTGPGTP